jgi:hypothetical protein
MVRHILLVGGEVSDMRRQRCAVHGWAGLLRVFLLRQRPAWIPLPLRAGLRLDELLLEGTFWAVDQVLRMRLAFLRQSFRVRVVELVLWETLVHLILEYEYLPQRAHLVRIVEQQSRLVAGRKRPSLMLIESTRTGDVLSYLVWPASRYGLAYAAWSGHWVSQCNWKSCGKARQIVSQCQKMKRLLKRCAATSSELWEGGPIGDFTFGRVDQGQQMYTYFSHTIVQPACVIYNSPKPVPT